VDGDLTERRRLVLAGIAIVGLGVLAACSTGGNGSDGDLLRDRSAAVDAVAQIEKAVGARPARIRDITIYPEYAIAEAQDPKNSEHIDRYMWRDGDVGHPEPVQLSGPQDQILGELFSTSAVRWRHLPKLVRTAERALERAQPTRIEDARGSYVIVRRSSGGGDAVVTISVYAEGPRRSGYAELTPTAEVVGVHVS
jgi:hypothetical protein